MNEMFIKIEEKLNLLENYTEILYDVVSYHIDSCDSNYTRLEPLAEVLKALANELYCCIDELELKILVEVQKSQHCSDSDTL